MAGEIDNLDEMEETDRPMISSGYFNEKGDRINKIPPSLSKKGLLKSSPNYLWQTFGIQSMIILSVPTISQNNLQISIIGPHIETLLRDTETGTRLIRDLAMLVSKIPRPDPLPNNLSDHLMKQENLHLKKKATASGSQPPVAQESNTTAEKSNADTANNSDDEDDDEKDEVKESEVTKGQGKAERWELLKENQWNQNI
ncbi:hypothetical protein DAPPUDRAFT_107280 [Daphnia pulex]|uniref:Uncharacterized protein n=1 Tax=Daphnia pulex TaxID=6669 RepID=E9GWL7_DAPPU|nr:hypothetical protein DAPPUDRAFT_107280 [Daphnia pulex]|eukprot:EFX76163.1 hypothetical protein DAPPUDRAFT_107280 [Daphnia pulex]